MRYSHLFEVSSDELAFGKVIYLKGLRFETLLRAMRGNERRWYCVNLFLQHKVFLSYHAITRLRFSLDRRELKRLFWLRSLKAKSQATPYASLLAPIEAERTAQQKDYLMC